MGCFGYGKRSGLSERLTWRFVVVPCFLCFSPSVRSSGPQRRKARVGEPTITCNGFSCFSYDELPEENVDLDYTPDLVYGLVKLLSAI